MLASKKMATLLQHLHPPLVAFKEWHVLCQALAAGEQTLILRKGGIAEGRSGFAFQHDSFLLFPTFFHAQYEGLQRPYDGPRPEENQESRETVSFSAYCRIVDRAILTDWSEVERLRPFHLWSDAVLHERFHYGDENALHLAVVRTLRLTTPLDVPYAKRLYGGCRSWVNVPSEETLEGLPVLEDKVFASQRQEIHNALSNNVIRVD